MLGVLIQNGCVIPSFLGSMSIVGVEQKKT